MPKIITYEQQVGATAPEVQSSVSTQTAGIEGQSIQQLGGAVQGFGEVLHQNEVKKDTLHSHVSVSQLRNKFELRKQAELQQGTLDTEKLINDYNTELNEVVGSLQTQDGKDYLTQAGSSLESDLIRSSAAAQAQLAGKMAAKQIITSSEFNVSTIRSNPAEFDNIMRDSLAFIEAQVANGSLYREDAEEFKRVTTNQYAESAVEGYASIAPDYAKKLLDDGKFDKFLPSGKKEQLYGTVRAYKSAAETEKLRVAKLEADAKDKISQEWQDKNYNDLATGNLPMQKILESPMSPEQKQKWQGWGRDAIERKFSTNKAVFNDLAQRIMLPPDDKSGQRITNQYEIMNYLGKGVDFNDVGELKKLLVQTPEGNILNEQRNRFFADAKGIVTKNPFTGEQVGNNKLADLTKLVLTMEQQMVKDGKNPNLIYDRDYKDNVWKFVNQYRTSPDDILNESLNMNNEDDSIDGKDVEEDKIREGEDDVSFLKRMGLIK